MARKRSPQPQTKTPQPRKKAAQPHKAEPTPASASAIPELVQDFLSEPAAPAGFRKSKPVRLPDLRRRLHETNVRLTVPAEEVLASINRVKSAPRPVEKLPDDITASLLTLKPRLKRFHGIKIPLYWFPLPWVISTCADRFGYMSTAAVRTATKLPFNATTQALLGQLGNMMADPGREPNPASQDPADAGVSSIPSGFVYFGQFVDHDITFDVSSTLDAEVDANTVNNMRSPSLDLDSLYGRGPGLDAFLYAFPSTGPSTAIKLQLGNNTQRRAGRTEQHRRARRHGHTDDVRRSANTGHEHGRHRRPAQRREPDRRSVPSGDAAVPQRGRRPAPRRLICRRHLRRSEADRHTPLPVGRRQRLPEAESAARPPSTMRWPLSARPQAAPSGCQWSSPWPPTASVTA